MMAEGRLTVSSLIQALIRQHSTGPNKGPNNVVVAAAGKGLVHATQNAAAAVY